MNKIARAAEAQELDEDAQDEMIEAIVETMDPAVAAAPAPIPVHVPVPVPVPPRELASRTSTASWLETTLSAGDGFLSAGLSAGEGRAVTTGLQEQVQEQEQEQKTKKKGSWTKREDNVLKMAVKNFQAVNGEQWPIRWKEIGDQVELNVMSCHVMSCHVNT
jgi:hypothetical protein